MAIGDFSRVNTNVQASKSLSALQKSSAELGMRQMRLATGSQLNRAEDDSAGLTISKKLEARVRGQAQAIDNIADAKGMLTVAEGGLNSVMDILQTMKSKAVQASNDTMGDDERTAINNEMTELLSEIRNIAGFDATDAATAGEGTDYNGNSLLNGTGGAGAGDFTFQVGADNGDEYAVTLGAVDVSDAATMGDGTNDIGALDVTTQTGAADAIASIDGAIDYVSSQLSAVGDAQKRLSFKSENLTTSMNNYDAARSRIADADFAKEQMKIVKLQILQQTGTAALAQANAGPQGVLQLLGG